MFFRKKDISDENVAKKSIRKMDRVVTGVLLGGIIASIYGVKKLRDKKDGDHHEVEITSPPEKPGLFSRIFFGKK